MGIPVSKAERETLQGASSLSYQGLALKRDLTLAVEGDEQETDENLIGFVTSGGYSWREGKSVAKGWVVLEKA